MKYRSLAAFPLGFAAAFAAVALFSGPDGLAPVLAVENEAGKVLALVGCFAAARAFEEGDYLRRAWFYSGLCYLLLVLGDVAGMPFLATHLSAHEVDLVAGSFAVLGNATSVLGTWMLARAWTVAGLEEDDDASRARGRLLFAAAVVVSLAITGWPLVHDAGALAAGDMGAAVNIASDLGDTICLALVAPVMQTALAMRGGTLRWPWGLLTSSGIAWIAYDAASGVVEALHVEQARWLIVTEAIRGLACAFFFAAGLAQRKAVTPAPPSAA
ncbi:MAG TPA: hypothetical protein VHS09_09255 [Polyangiaceae bacterium]|jgi:hypothetical protein|nr:hypothetical protein [Polyangiaceae bacterium]